MPDVNSPFTGVKEVAIAEVQSPFAVGSDEEGKGHTTVVREVGEDSAEYALGDKVLIGSKFKSLEQETAGDI